MFFALPLLTWASGFGDPADRCGESRTGAEVRPDEGLGLRAEVACLMAEIGPRPSYSVGTERLLGHLAASFPSAWVVDRGPGGTVLGCLNGPDSRTLLLLAHVDAVHPEVPGASDNLAAVVLLRDLVRRLDAPARTVCVGFPDGEELGLVDSSALAKALAGGARYAGGSLRRDTLDLVVSVDLFGRGEPVWNGVGRAWDVRRLDWLLQVAPARVPFVNRAISAARPGAERSDHGPFAKIGVPALHLMGKAEGGVVWAYHTPADDIEVLEPARLKEGGLLLLALAHAPPIPEDVDGEPALVLAPGALPAWILPARTATMVAVGLALLAGGFAGWRAPRPRLRDWATLCAAVLVGIGALYLALAGRVPGAALADGAVGAAVFAASAAALAGGRPGAVGPAGWAAALQGGVALLSGLELLLVPPALACAGIWAQRAVSARLAPWAWFAVAPVALWTSGFLVRPDAARELIFHGFLDDRAWSVSTLFLVGAAPGLGYVAGAPVAGAARLRAALVLLVLAAVLVVATWSTHPWSPPFVFRDPRTP